MKQCYMLCNSLWPSHAIWRQTSGSALACSVTASSHYLNQCWHIISKVNFIPTLVWLQIHKRYVGHQSLKLALNYLSKISSKFPRGQWDNLHHLYWCLRTFVLMHTTSLMVYTHTSAYTYFDGLVQERHNSNANGLELRLACTNPSLWRNSYCCVQLV